MGNLFTLYCVQCFLMEIISFLGKKIWKPEPKKESESKKESEPKKEFKSKPELEESESKPELEKSKKKPESDESGSKEPDFYSWGKKGNGNGEFNIPCAIATYDNLVFVADAGNHRICVFDEYGKFLYKWGYYGWNYQDDQLREPASITIDGGRVYVADHGNHRVCVYNTGGEFLYKIKTNKHPSAVAVQGKNVYTTHTGDNHVYQYIYGEHARKWEIYEWSELDDKYGCQYPFGITLYGSRVFAVDPKKSSVKVFDLNGNFLRQWDHIFDDRPTFIAIDEGKVFVTDEKKIIYIFDLNGKFLRKGKIERKGKNIAFANDIAFTNGKMLMTDLHNNRVNVVPKKLI